MCKWPIQKTLLSYLGYDLKEFKIEETEGSWDLSLGYYSLTQQTFIEHE